MAAGSIGGLPPDVEAAWREVRQSFGAGAYTACELMCRKILMHVAVDAAGSKAGKAFVDYIDDLEKKGYLPTGLKTVVDLVRQRGNTATHDLPASSEADASQTMRITRHLLESTYELPGLAPAPPPP